MRHISKGVEQGRRLQKVHFAFASVLLCDAQVQAVPQKLLLVMAVVLHGQRLPQTLACLRTYSQPSIRKHKADPGKNNPTHPVLHFRASQCYSPTCPFLAWLSASVWQQQDEFPSILSAFGGFPALKGTVPQGLGFLHHTPKGRWCSGADNHYCQRSFATVNLYRGI